MALVKKTKALKMHPTKTLLALSLVSLSLIAYATSSTKIKDALATVPKTQDCILMYSNLASKLNTPSLKGREAKEVHLFLADYATRCHIFDKAGEHYLEAFNIASSLKEKDAKQHLVRSLKSFIMAGEIEMGYAVYGKLSALKEETPSLYEMEAELYIQYLHLSESLNDNSVDVGAIIKNLENYAKNKKFASFRCSILLVLYFIADDKSAKIAILKEYPKSMEAMLVEDNALILPTTFWYLIPTKTHSSLDASSSSDVDISIPKAYQIGFFKQKEYALKQVKKLQNMGFVVELKEEKRDGNNVYYAVFVLEKEGGKTRIKLQDASIESFPIFE